MKWYTWVIIGILVLIVIGYFTNWFGMGKGKNNLEANNETTREVSVTECGAFNTLVAPPDGKRYACVKRGANIPSWELVDFGTGGIGISI